MATRSSGGGRGRIRWWSCRPRAGKASTSATVSTDRFDGGDVLADPKVVDKELRGVQNVPPVDEGVDVDEEVEGVAERDPNQDVKVRVAHEDWQEKRGETRE